MSDILLVQPPIEDFYLTAKRTVPYGLASIAASLIEVGFTVEILDGLATSRSRPIPTPQEMGHLEPYYGKPDLSPFGLFHQYRHYGYSYEHIAEKARRSRAWLVGISSLFTAYSDCAIRCARAIKERHPQCTIVMGGHHPTELPQSVMECPAVDCLIRGEGEESMPLLAKALRQGASLETVPGMVFRDTAGNVHVSPPAMASNLDHCPPPAHHLLNRKYYSRGKKGTLTLVASRGCPFQCTYCSTSRTSCITYRRRTLEKVREEIEKAMESGQIGFIDLEDENISLHKEWFLQLLAFISRKFPEGSVELRAMNGLYPPTLDEEVVAAMKSAGFKTLNLSLGTTRKEQAKRFKRRDVTDSFDHVCRLAEKHGMDTVGYILVGAPGQYAEDSLMDLLFLAERPVLAGVSIYYPAPGSEDFETCRRLDLLPRHFSLMRSTAVSISHTTSRDEAVTLLRLGRLLNFIKSLVKQGWKMGAKGTPEAASPPLDTRTATGLQLLESFLRDGCIRGITPSGEIYPHRQSTHISERFAKAIREVNLKSVEMLPTGKAQDILNNPKHFSLESQ